MRLVRGHILFIVFCFAGLASMAKVKLPTIISDNMVMQCGMKTPVWGSANPGEKIQIQLNGKTYYCTTDKTGCWRVKMDNLKPGGPFEMTVTGTENKLIIHNVLIGEVWLASGQSNMEFGIQTELNGQKAIQEATDSFIRFFYVPMAASLEEKKEIDPVSSVSLNAKWVVCSPETMAKNWAWHGFSAVGYYFAQQIRKTTGTAIGMIGSYKGGTEAQTWISHSGFSLNPILPQYLKEHQRLLDEAKTTDKKADNKGPSNLYNAMISPICPFGIRGVIWYQGESNGDNLNEALEYKDIFPRLIKDWRKNWQQGNFPFLYVQLPNFKKAAQTPSEGNWAWVREAQSKTLSLPHTGMAVTIDLGDPIDIHPKDKAEVGRRLALVANQQVYKMNILASGPVYRSMKINNHEIWLTFSSIGSGLSVNGLKGFGIAGTDGKFIWAKAEIKGDQVIVSNETISKPVAVRYDWGDNPSGNLANREELPASPFRTDNWIPETQKK